MIISHHWTDIYLMQSSEAIDVGSVAIGAILQHALDFIFVSGTTRSKEDAAGGELDTLVFSFRRMRFSSRIRLIPALELFGPLEEGRITPIVQRHM